MAQGCKPSSTNCSQNNNNKVGDLKIYGTQSSAIGDVGTDDTDYSIHEQGGNRLPYVFITDSYLIRYTT